MHRLQTKQVGHVQQLLSSTYRDLLGLRVMEGVPDLHVKP